MSRVRVCALTQAFGDHQVLNGVDLEVDDGEVMAVLGPSGCGKTTLLRIVAGFLEPDSGQVLIDDVLVADGTRTVPAWERKVGYVPQEGALFPHLDVRQNILFGLPRRQRTDHRLAEMLELAELPADIAGSYPRELSGGQQQRVALARALAPRPGLVLLDEPFSSLDAALRASAGREVMRLLRQAGSTALLVTHDQGEALSLADRVAVMEDGLVGQVDRPAMLYGAPSSVRIGTFVGDANLLRGQLAAGCATCVLGKVVLHQSAVAPEGASVTMLVRPEQLRIDTVGSAGAQARVEHVTYYGSHASVRLILEDGTALVARVDPAQAPEAGTLVGVEVLAVAGIYP